MSHASLTELTVLKELEDLFDCFHSQGMTINRDKRGKALLQVTNSDGRIIYRHTNNTKTRQLWQEQDAEWKSKHGHCRTSMNDEEIKTAIQSSSRVNSICNRKSNQDHAQVKEMMLEHSSRSK